MGQKPLADNAQDALIAFIHQHIVTIDSVPLLIAPGVRQAARFTAADFIARRVKGAGQRLAYAPVAAWVDAAVIPALRL